MIGTIIYHILSNAQAVSDIAGNRIYPVVAAQDSTLPYVVYNQISRVPNANKERIRQVETYRIQIDMYAANYDQLSDLADAVVNTLSFYSGNVSDTEVDVILFEDENDGFEPDNEVFRKTHDYNIRIKP